MPASWFILFTIRSKSPSLSRSAIAVAPDTVFFCDIQEVDRSLKTSESEPLKIRLGTLPLGIKSSAL